MTLYCGNSEIVTYRT